ncbi:MAG: hypothetical protein ACD_79C00388G0001 [uncultured bacterium]|nr:MAG: hypothetical protein ACD_79C00388G0001 [uncultured bacterium]
MFRLLLVFALIFNSIIYALPNNIERNHHTFCLSPQSYINYKSDSRNIFDFSKSIQLISLIIHILPTIIIPTVYVFTDFFNGIILYLILINHYLIHEIGHVTAIKKAGIKNVLIFLNTNLLLKSDFNSLTIPQIKKILLAGTGFHGLYVIFLYIISLFYFKSQIGLDVAILDKMIFLLKYLSIVFLTDLFINQIFPIMKHGFYFIGNKLDGERRLYYGYLEYIANFKGINVKKIPLNKFYDFGLSPNLSFDDLIEISHLIPNNSARALKKIAELTSHSS